MMRIVCRVLAAIGALQLSGCGSSSVNELPADGLLTIGTWGGDSAGVIVTDTLTHVHIGCTYGDIRGRVSIDTDGRFARAGSYLLRAYPVTIRPTMPAQFTGRLSGSILTITVTVRDTVARTDVVLGPVSTRLGTTPRMANCPICATPGVRASVRREDRSVLRDVLKVVSLARRTHQ
jgi:hypothetical protein